MRKDTKKKFLIAQEFFLHASYYYTVEADTMGEALVRIEEDPDVLPVGMDQHAFKVLGYTDSEDSYDS